MIDYIKTASILSRLRDAPDPYFGITWNMNLYRGCQHGCIYCDTRSNVYGVGDLSHIRIKENALQLLSGELSVKRLKGTIGTGSMNDPYMPAAFKSGMTRKAIEVIHQFRFPVHIITKSDLVVHDVDILSAMQKTYAAVSFTITTCDDTLSGMLEPGAPRASQRIKALKKLSKQGIYCGVVLTPVLPFITDHEDNIKRIVHASSDAGAKYILCWMGMTQRDGQREYYYNKLNEKFPGIKNKYVNTYGTTYSCNSPNASRLYEVFNETCRELGIARKMHFYNYNRPSQLNLFGDFNNE